MRNCGLRPRVRRLVLRESTLQLAALIRIQCTRDTNQHTARGFFSHAAAAVSAASSQPLRSDSALPSPPSPACRPACRARVRPLGSGTSSCCCTGAAGGRWKGQSKTTERALQQHRRRRGDQNVRGSAWPKGQRRERGSGLVGLAFRAVAHICTGTATSAQGGMRAGTDGPTSASGLAPRQAPLWPYRLRYHCGAFGSAWYLRHGRLALGPAPRPLGTDGPGR